MPPKITLLISDVIIAYTVTNFHGATSIAIAGHRGAIMKHHHSVEPKLKTRPHSFFVHRGDTLFSHLFAVATAFLSLARHVGLCAQSKRVLTGIQANAKVFFVHSC